MRGLFAITLSLLGMFATGCAENPPLHSGLPSKHAEAARSPECQALYGRTDQLNAERIDSEPAALPDSANQKADADTLASAVSIIQQSRPKDDVCWDTSWEQHKDYDLFFVEFDDTGMAADLRSTPFGESELSLLYTQLQNYQIGKQPLNIVLFTHGWHGSSKSDSWYTIEFRSLLKNLSQLEQTRRDSTETDAALTVGPRRVVGIDISWRGDSIQFPSRVLSVWDRKQAAETLALGAVQGLFAHMHDYYLDNTCHVDHYGSIPGDASRCGRVRMLTLGHSYGALIDFRSLVGNVAAGLNVDSDTARSYSFGDLVILLNPAFEGVRYRPTFLEATRRKTYVGSDPGSVPAGGAQLPVLITLQSLGDNATGFWFPRFRDITTVFDNPIGADERNENVHALGWIDAFTTHSLKYEPRSPMSGDPCDGAPSKTTQYSCRANLWASQQYLPVGETPLYVGGKMSLTSPPRPQKLPPYFPLWLVQVDKEIMKDHDDIWNQRINDVILQFYWATVLQADQVALNNRQLLLEKQTAVKPLK